jgi:pyruvate dehydrogenase phosphatase
MIYFQVMNFNTVLLPAASSTERLHALAEVEGFGTTDMGVPGQGPWTYRILQESSIEHELTRISNAKSFDAVDSLSFQPCAQNIFQNQDRHIVQQWELPGGQWLFACILDGPFLPLV